MNYAKHVQTLATPQSEPIPGTTQVANSGGGFAWEVNDWTKLDRFLILGNEGGSYYAGEKEMTVMNADAIMRCIKADGVRTVNRIVEISVAGRAPKNNPAIFALALAASQGDLRTRALALAELSKVARTGTQLFMFLDNLKGMRGWGRGLRRAVREWYNGKEPAQLAYQLLKYRQRGGRSHRDVLRLASPKPKTAAHNALYRWVVASEAFDARSISRRETKQGPMVTKHYDAIAQSSLPPLVIAFDALQKVTNVDEVVALIKANRSISHEMIPSEFLGDAKVWAALLPNLGPMALVRNLARMTANGLIAPMSDAAGLISNKLSDSGFIREMPPIHPIAVLAALMTYRQGRSSKGDLTWTPVNSIVDALDGAFYTAFGNVKPAGNRKMLCLDLSRSMAGSVIAGIPGLTPRLGAAAMALVTKATEANCMITGFTAHGTNPIRYDGVSNENMELAVSELSISPRQRLDDVLKVVEAYGEDGADGKRRFGGTDCSLPMQYALAKGINVDTFVIYTDSQTWAGQIHPAQALQEYRRKTGIQAKLVVVGMVANEFSIADPNDPGMLDVVGFDTATPDLISQF